MRIAMDCTPLIGQLTGIGHYTKNLLGQLVAQTPDKYVATAFSVRGRGALRAAVPRAVEVRSRPFPARGLRALWEVGQQPTVGMLAGRCDVFHATNFVLPPLGRAAGVLTIHDLAYLTRPDTVAAASRAYEHLVPQGIDRAAVICTPSNAVAQQVQEAYRIDTDRIAVTHLGVDEAWLQVNAPDLTWRNAHGLPNEYLLAVGTIEPRKNLRYLIEAYRLALRQGIDLPPLVLVGGTGWGSALELDSLPADRVLTPGHLPLAELRKVVAGASALAFPSLDEGFGLPPLEALACGVPVVCSDIPVTHEVLGAQGRYVPLDDVDAFAAALSETIFSPSGDPATRRAHAATFTWSACAQATYGAYQRANLTA